MQRERNDWITALIYVVLVVAFIAYGYGFGLFVPYLIVPFIIPVALLVALIVWALPEGEYAPLSLLQPLFTCFFVSLFLWPDYLAIVLPGLPWITLRRLFGIPLLFLLLVSTSTSKNFRTQVKDTLTADMPTTIFFIAFLVIQTLSIGLSSQVPTSINKYIVAQTNWTSIFFVSCFLFRKPGYIDRWAKTLLVIGAVLCGLGIWERRLGQLPWANHIPPFFKIDDPTVLTTLAGMSRAGVGIHRVTTTQSTPLGLAEFLGLTAPFAIHFVVGKYSLPMKIAAGIYIPMAFAVIIFTDSRLGVVACLISIMLYVLIWATTNWRSRRSSIIAPAIVLAYPAFFVMVAAATFVVPRLRAMVWGNGSQDASNEGRKEQFMMGFPKIFHRPIGYGVGRGAATLDYRISDGSLTIDSYFLSVALEYGVLGFFFYYAIFARSGWMGAKASMSVGDDRDQRYLLPISISIFSFIFIKAVFSQEDSHSLAFMLLGANLALLARVRQQNRAPAADAA